MSTDAFFFFHMDPENRLGEPSSPKEPTSAPAHQPTASTSSSSVVSFRDRTRFLVEYSPKPTRVMYTPPQPVAAESSNSQAIHRWLAGQRPYTYIPDSERSSFSESESESEADNTSTSSESESDEDQIYLRPRRQHSSPSIAIRRSSPVTASVSPAARRAWPVSAAKPALPVLDLREATAFTTQEQDKSHWSDDEEDFAEGEEEWADDDDLPALDADVDTGAASSSTRSLPIPIFNPPRTRSQPLLGAPSQKPCVNIDNWRPESPQNDFDALWDASYQSPVGRRAPCKAIQIQEGQSFYTPWIAGYIAQNN